MREELKFKLWVEYPELREELFGDELAEEELSTDDWII